MIKKILSGHQNIVTLHDYFEVSNNLETLDVLGVGKYLC